MAAVPFKATLQFRTATGRIFSHRMALSDVNDEFGEYQDGSEVLQLPSAEGTITLFDIILSADGEDTSQMEIFINAKDTGVIVNNPACVGTVINRQFMTAPMVIGPGSQIRFKQVT